MNTKTSSPNKKLKAYIAKPCAEAEYAWAVFAYTPGQARNLGRCPDPHDNEYVHARAWRRPNADHLAVDNGHPYIDESQEAMRAVGMYWDFESSCKVCGLHEFPDLEYSRLNADSVCNGCVRTGAYAQEALCN